MDSRFDSPTEILEARIDWTQAVLARELVRGRRYGYFTGEPIEPRDPDELREAIALRLALQPIDASPMGRICERFALEPVEEDVLWLLACCEVEPGLSRLAHSIASSGMTQLSVQHVGRLANASSTALERLATWGLIEIERDPRAPIHRRKIRIDDRVLDLVCGSLGADPALNGIAELVGPFHSPCEVPPTLAHAMTSEDDILVVAIGSEGSDRELVLRAAMTRATMLVHCANLATDPEPLQRQLRAIARETRLSDVAPLFAGADRLFEAGHLFEQEILAKTRGPVLVSMTKLADIIAASERATVIHTVTPPDAETRRRLWRAHLTANDVTAADDVIDACVDRYRLPTELLGQIARTVVAQTTSPAMITVEDVQSALRARLDRKLSGFARRVEWNQSWADLVLPGDQIELLIELVSRTRHRRRVLTDWGFAAKVGKGFGVSALFSGPPGTGKTMIAGLVARELGLDLYQVDLSKVVSKYIGETEKQLAALFDAAEFGQAIILFDEADSLFGKRTDVKSSNDRYANLETNYLLQRLEGFEGICLLTSNHETSIDEAFMRRLSLHVRVPMPDEDHREKLWRAMIPATAETEGDFDFSELAQRFVMSGGYIKNAVVRAAYLAAAEDHPIGLVHFERAARAEYESMGKVAYQGGDPAPRKVKNRTQPAPTSVEGTIKMPDERLVHPESAPRAQAEPSSKKPRSTRRTRPSTSTSSPRLWARCASPDGTPYARTHTSRSRVTRRYDSSRSRARSRQERRVRSRPR